MKCADACAKSMGSLLNIKPYKFKKAIAVAIYWTGKDV